MGNLKEHCRKATEDVSWKLPFQRVEPQADRKSDLHRNKVLIRKLKKLELFELAILTSLISLAAFSISCISLVM